MQTLYQLTTMCKKIVKQNLPFRISLIMVFTVAVLLTSALCFILCYAHRVMKQDAKRNAVEALDYTIQNIDNTLYSVEQSAGNIYWELINHIDEPDKLQIYSRKLVETNPCISGCIIAMKPGYYKDQDRLFLAYHYRSKDSKGNPVIRHADTFGIIPYTGQEWYTRPIEKNAPCWIEPSNRTKTEAEAVTAYSIPIYKNNRIIGVLSVNISMVLLSKIVHDTKPTPNSYTILMGNNGSFIVYPDSGLLTNQIVLKQRMMNSDPTVIETGRDMTQGKTGYRKIVTEQGDCYAFFKPFKRTIDSYRSKQELNWSAAVVFPEKDVMNIYKRMQTNIIVIALICLIILFSLCWYNVRKQILPLRQLTESTRRITDGHYNEIINDTTNIDEVGMLQKNFRQMQLSLSAHITQMRQLTQTLQEREKGLEKAYEQAKEGERLKTAVMHNISKKMLPPGQTIFDSVDKLYEEGAHPNDPSASSPFKEIINQGAIITNLLDEILRTSQEKHNT